MDASSSDKRASSEDRKERKRAKREAAAAAAAATTAAPSAVFSSGGVITSSAITSAVPAAVVVVDSEVPRAETTAETTLFPTAAHPFAHPFAMPAAVSEQAVTSVPTWAFPTEESLPHLCCSVCLSFPEAEVLQCHSGHVLCRSCHDRVCVEEKPTCPTCRTPIDALKPVRNVALEQTLALLPVQCPNRPCAEKLTRGCLARHLEFECKQRKCSCKYALLGCKWNGVAAELNAHVDQCKKAEQPGWKLLKKVAECAQETTRKHEEARAEALRYQKIVEMLSSRCKNIGVLNLTLHKCSASEHVAGRPAHLMTAAFHVLGFRFKLYTVPEPSSGTAPARYLAVLKLCDSRMPLPVDLFLLSAPGSAVDVAPVSHRHTFAAFRQRSTEPLLLAEGAAADTLNELEVLQLRLGIVDRRSGRLSRSFQGQASSGSRWTGSMPGSVPGEEGEGGWDSEAYGDSHSMDGEELGESEGPSDEGDSEDDHMTLTHRQREQLLHDRHHWNFY